LTVLSATRVTATWRPTIRSTSRFEGGAASAVTRLRAAPPVTLAWPTTWRKTSSVITWLRGTHVA
jgi:hypothetical protein